MNNLLGSALILAIWSGICGMDLCGPQFMLWRPLISGTVAGLLLGDLRTGLIVAGGVELTWLVLVNIGGAAPPDVTVGGIAAVATAVFTKTTDVATAIAGALPVALVVQQLFTVATLVNTAWVHRMDAAAERSDIVSAERWHLFAGFATFFLTYSIPVFIAVYLGIPVVQNVMNQIPKSVIAGLGTASGLLPALGITLLLSQFLTNVNWPYFLIGFMLAAFLKLPVIGTAAVAGALAFLLYFAREAATPAASTATAAPARKGVLTKQDRFRMFLRALGAFPSFSPERHNAGTFNFVMGPLYRKLFKTKEEISAAMKRHLLFYNVQPTLTTLVMGSVAAMEEQMEDKEPIIAYKAGVMGPLAGIGDSLIWFTLMPLSFAIGASLAAQGNVLGPIVALALFNVVNIPLKYWGMEFGYSQGSKFIQHLRSGLVQRISQAATLMGLMVMGTAVANVVSVGTSLAIPLEPGKSMPLQPIIDQIFPKLLTMLLVLLLLYLLRKRVNPVVILLGLLVFGVVLHVVGILA